jgi:type IV pilus assembly protein PilY1
VNTTIPPSSSLGNCSSTIAGGWTMAINPATGGAFTQSFFGANHTFVNVNGQVVSGEALSGTGSPSVVTYGTGTYLVTQTVSGSGTVVAINPPVGTIGSRLTWIQRR